MTEKARKLDLLCIDDEIKLPQSELLSNFNCTHIDSFIECQSWLSRPNSLRPDLIVSDISFAKDASLQGALVKTPEGSPLIPVGLILALPFLDRRTVVAVRPYSQFFSNGKLNSDRTFLVTMGLILSRMHGRTFRSSLLEEGHADYYDNDISELIKIMSDKTINDVAAAILSVVASYRDQLCGAVRKGIVKIRNLPELYKIRDELRMCRKKSIEVHDAASVNWVASAGTDSVRFQSLFADCCIKGRFRTDMVDQLEVFIDAAAEVEDPLFEDSLRCVRAQVNSVEPFDGRLERIDKVIARNVPHADAKTRREILRLCVLFANLHALLVAANEARAFLKADVYSRLGLYTPQALDPKSYKRWFENKNISRDILGPNIAALEPFSEGTDGLFLNEDANLDSADILRLRRYMSEMDDEPVISAEKMQRYCPFLG